MGGIIRDDSPVKHLHEKWQNSDQYLQDIWNVYNSLSLANGKVPLYVISDTQQLIKLWQEKYSCGIEIPNLISNKLSECGIHKLRKADLSNKNSISKLQINYECIRDFCIMLNSRFIVGDDVSFFSKVALRVKQARVNLIQFKEKNYQL